MEAISSFDVFFLIYIFVAKWVEPKESDLFETIFLKWVALLAYLYTEKQKQNIWDLTWVY